MTGAEYITASVLERLWTEIADAFRSELAESKASVQEFLQRRSAAWHLVGRVHFNLAENRRDDEAPFAFLATYTTHLSTQARARAHSWAHSARRQRVPYGHTSCYSVGGEVLRLGRREEREAQDGARHRVRRNRLPHRARRPARYPGAPEPRALRRPAHFRRPTRGLRVSGAVRRG